MIKSFPKRSSPKFKLLNLLKRIHEMVVHKFSTFPFEATFAFLQPSASSERCFSSTGLTVSELKMQSSDEHLEALNVMHCNKALL